MWRNGLGVWTLAVLVLVGPALAQLQLASVFTDHAVLQRDVDLPVWGTARPGAKVTVQFAEQAVTAQADQTGRWRIVLEPSAASMQPQELVVVSEEGEAQERIILRDLLVGDVWLCTGQSNMGTSMAGTQYWPEMVPSADIPGIRLLALGGNAGYGAAEPREGFPDKWYPCTPATALKFSAIGFIFGKEIHERTGVPIGLVKAISWGADAERFVPLEALAGEALFQPLAQKAQADAEAFNELLPERLEKYQKQKEAYDQKRNAFNSTVAEGDAGLRQQWQQVDTDTSGWDEVTMPANLDATGLKGFGGSVWLRKDISIPAGWVDQPLRMYLGGFGDNQATVYFNGEAVGTASADTDALGFAVRTEKAEANAIVVRIIDDGGSPASMGSRPFTMYIAAKVGAPVDERIPLAGDWKYREGHKVAEADLPPREPAKPSHPGERGAGSLYNGMIAPLAGFGIKGVLWYQGESNGDRAQQYATLFPLVIRSWRQAWGSDFAFLYVQLPNYIRNGKPADHVELPDDAMPDALPLGWAPLREVQLKSLSIPNTAMVVTIDCGQTWDIHPNNKKIVAERLAQAAMGTQYGSDNAHSGPIYRSMTIDGPRIRLQMDHVGGGLVAKDGPLKTFAIAGEDRIFKWATATIDGESIVVESDQVRSPVAVRYAFSADPKGANLFNAAGLPASPFRTDTWELPQGDQK